MHITQTLYHILNISRHEIGRVSKLWLLYFFSSIGYFLCFTVTLALFIEFFGSENLPAMYLLYSVSIILGALFYSTFQYRLKLFSLMICTVGLILLFALMPSFVTSHFWFLFFVILTLGVGIWQLQILLSRLKEEWFTPLESPRVTPLIETTEPLGGILAGAIILVLTKYVHLESFLFIVAGIFLLFGILFALFHFFEKKVLVFEAQETHTHQIVSVKRGFEHIKAIPFMRGMAVIVLCWIISLTLIDIQYTRALEHFLHHGVSEGHSTDHLSNLLFERLGEFQIMFSALILFIQLFVTSRAIRYFGIIKTFFFLPIVTGIATFTALFFPSLGAFVFSKASIEATGVLHKTSYHHSYYTIPENIREYIREIFEGVFRPLGIFIGTLFVFIIQYFIPSSYQKVVLLIILALLLCIIFLLLRFPNQYGSILKKNLSLHVDPKLQHNAVELLSQKSHKDAAEILSKALLYQKEDSHMKIKILNALGDLKEAYSLPEILTCLEDPDLEVRIAACHALSQFKNLGTHIFSQAFSKHKIITTLTSLLYKENSKRFRHAIIQVFANIQHADIAVVLLDMLEKSDDEEMKAHCISAMGLFNDINIWHYLSSYLSSKNPHIASNSIIALWKFPKYRLQLLIHLLRLLESHEKESLLSGIYAVGEIQAVQEKPRLSKLTQNEDPMIRLYAAVSLLKMDEKEIIPTLITVIFEEYTLSYQTLHMLYNIHNGSSSLLWKQIKFEAHHIIHELFLRYGHKEGAYEHMTNEELLRLILCYTILSKEHEIARIKTLIKSRDESLLKWSEHAILI